MRVIPMAVVGLLLTGPVQGKALPAVRLQVEGKLPFSEQDLVDLVRLRLPLARDGVRAVVRTSGQDRVVIQVGRSQREARIDEQSALDSARLVALLLLDLVADQQAPGPPRPPPSPSTVARPASPPRSTLPRVRLNLSTLASFVNSSAAVAGVEPVLGLDVRLLGTWMWATLEAGYLWAPSRRVYAPQYASWDVSFTAVPVRSGLALRLGWFELRGGAVVEPFWIGGPVEDRGVRVGGTVALRGSLALGRWLALHFTAGVDLFPSRDSYSVWIGDDCGGWTGMTCGYEEQVITTSWAVPWVGLGLAFQGGG